MDDERDSWDDYECESQLPKHERLVIVILSILIIIGVCILALYQ